MFGMKRVLMLVIALGVVGAVIYAVRIQRSSSEPVPVGARDAHAEEDESAPSLRVREAGSATA